MFGISKLARSRLPALIAIACVLAAIAIGGGAMLANASSTPPMIYACVSTKNGSITIVDATATCSKNEYSVSWQSGSSSPPPPPSIITRYASESGFQIIGTSQFQAVATTTITVPDSTTVTATGSATLETTTGAGVADCEIQITGSSNSPFASVPQSGSASPGTPGNIAVVTSYNVSADTLTVNLMCRMETGQPSASGEIQTAELLVQAVPTN